jgi:peptide-methionine (S)-S-oxide reductase
MDLTETQIKKYDRRALDSDDTETTTFRLGCF